MTLTRAFARLLAGTKWRAVRVGEAAWRIEPALSVPALAASRPSASIAGDEIVVSAIKRPMDAQSIPAAIEVVDGDSLARVGDQLDTAAVGAITNGLFATNLGPGRDRLFIRGVSDSPFDGFGQSSVAVQVGEVRATYDAPDPDLRLVDMQRVELLKGPQGPLYGSGALGGVYRLVPAPPDLVGLAGNLRLGTSVTDSGAPAGNADAMLNLPLVDDRIALRAVAYGAGQGGWIDSGSRRDSNHGRTTGGRVAVRAIAGSWTIDATALAQSGTVADSQYVEGKHVLQRAARIAEPQDTDFSLAGITATGSLGTLHATVVTSMAWQELSARYDVSARAGILGGSAPASIDDNRHYRVATIEARIGGKTAGFEWLAGASLLDSRTDASSALADAGGSREILRMARDVDEIALFGEASPK